jgi:flagellar motility protein MotE (MotC chaperone)/sporulation protein YlmC with PRC-barrel domain
VFEARLAGLAVYDPIGDQVGKVRDIVLTMHGAHNRPEAKGLVVEVPGRKRVFMPIQRVTSLDAGQVISTGVLNLRRFAKKDVEVLAIAEVLEVQVSLQDGSPAVVEDLAMQRSPRGVWAITKVFVRRGKLQRGLRLRRRGETLLVDVDAVQGLSDDAEQGASMLLATFAELKAADIAEMLHDMSGKRRAELAVELDDERLADVLEELPEDDQIEIINNLPRGRAADVLEAMQPDDAADLLAELSTDLQEELLGEMEDEDAEDVRRLLAYDENTAGGLMTTEPIILGPQASVAEALAMVRREDVSPSLAAAVFVTRAPQDTPTGTFLGVVHLQRMLREPPHRSVGDLLDRGLEPIDAEAGLRTIHRRLATYNLVSLPVTDDEDRLIGAVTVDDVLDHLLPEDWRETDDDDDDDPESTAPAEVIRG